MKSFKWFLRGITFMCAVVIFTARCGKDPVPPGPNPVPVVSSVQIGTPAIAGQSYMWMPMEGLDNPTAAQPMASPKCTTKYTVTATNQCGVVSSSMTVPVWKKGPKGNLIEVKCPVVSRAK